MTAVTAVMIAYHNIDKTLTRLQRDLLPALRRCQLETELIVFDNSKARSRRLAEAVEDNGTFDDARYRWQGGANPMYGPTLNHAVRLAKHPHLLYVCTNHGRSYDPTWPFDLLAPLADDDVAMTGTLADAGPPAALGFPDLTSAVHIQGGVFAARTEVLRKFPYPDGRYAHGGSDLVQSFQLMRAGWKLVDVPTVRSMWWGTAGEGDWKYVHERC